MLLAHRTEQESERRHAGSEWREGDWVWASPTGIPSNPPKDWTEWTRLLRDGGVRDTACTTHDARHTAATILLLLGLDQRAMMGVVGWPYPAIAQHDARIVEPVCRELASRLDELLWGPQNTGEAGPTGPQ